MVNIFPELLTYEFFAPTLLRVGIGFYFLISAFWHFGGAQKKHTISSFWFWALGSGEFILATLFILGLWTQIAALFGAIGALKMMFFKRGHFAELVPNSRLMYLFVLMISLSLLLTGAGGFAFDLPF